MVFDIDDAVFERYADSKSILVRFFLGRKFDRVFSRADLVIAGNQYLADKAVTAGASRVEVIPTGFEEMDAEIPVKAADSDVPVIVWIGTPSTVGYLELIREALAGVYKKADFLIRVIGAEIDWDEIPVENVPWSADTEMKWLRSASIGVMPLPDQPWEKGKCGFKLIQYMASGLPVVASPVGVNCEIVEPEVTGYLANGSKDWEDSILKLLSSPDLRRELGQRGNAKFRKEYSTSVVEVSLFNSLTSI